jgi:hypothetical protein|tara:strand:+ start:260 stop:589 length:330 start_codon:yes stop_codon:yes gene_type:complete
VSILFFLSLLLGAARKLRGHRESGPGQFSLLGIDLLLDKSGKFWLIEFTKGPAYRMSPPYLEDLHTRLLQRTVDISFAMRDAARAKGDAALATTTFPPEVRGGWTRVEI